MQVNKNVCKKCLWYDDCRTDPKIHYWSCSHLTLVADDGTIEESLDEYLLLAKEFNDDYNAMFCNRDDERRSCVVVRRDHV